MSELPQISNAEWEVMRIIWEKSPVKSSQIISILENSKDWKPKTIQTLIRRLLDKGVIEYRVEGKAYVYSYIIAEEKYINHETETFISKVYQGSLSHMMLNFMKNKDLTDNEIMELINILRNKKSK